MRESSIIAVPEIEIANPAAKRQAMLYVYRYENRKAIAAMRQRLKLPMMGLKADWSAYKKHLAEIETMPLYKQWYSNVEAQHESGEYTLHNEMTDDSVIANYSYWAWANANPNEQKLSTELVSAFCQTANIPSTWYEFFMWLTLFNETSHGPHNNLEWSMLGITGKDGKYSIDAMKHPGREDVVIRLHAAVSKDEWLNIYDQHLIGRKLMPKDDYATDTISLIAMSKIMDYTRAGLKPAQITVAIADEGFSYTPNNISALKRRATKLEL